MSGQITPGSESAWRHDVLEGLRRARARREAAEDVEHLALDTYIALARNEGESIAHIAHATGTPVLVIAYRLARGPAVGDVSRNNYTSEQEWLDAHRAAWPDDAAAGDVQAPFTRVVQPDGSERAVSRSERPHSD